MSQESAFEFVGRIARDEKFRHEYLTAKANNVPDRFLKEMGFDFSLAELQIARNKQGFSLGELGLTSSLNDKRSAIGAESIVAAFCGCDDPGAPAGATTGRR